MARVHPARLDELSFSTLIVPTLERLKTSDVVPDDPGGAPLSPTRIVGFPETPLSPHSVLGTSISPVMSRQSSLTELLLQPGELVTSPRLAIRTTKGSSAALRSGQPSRARSSAQIFRITPPVAAAEYQQQYRQGAARRTASAMVFPTGPVVDPSTTCLALSRLHHSSSLQIPRMHHASTCPSELDEDLVAAALRAYPTVGTPPSSLPSDNPLSRDPRESASTSPCSSYGTAASTLPPSPWAAHFFRSAQQTHAGLTRQLFDAQAEAATAHAQVHCLQEALTKERAQVERLEAEVARLQMQLGELQGSSAAQLRLALSQLQDTGGDTGTEGDSGQSAGASGYDTAYGSPVDGTYGSALEEEECPPTVPAETALPLDSPFDWSQ
ncbi:hypothetical protein N2152v2_004384 [Parachlorella kessleri]